MGFGRNLSPKREVGILQEMTVTREAVTLDEEISMVEEISKDDFEGLFEGAVVVQSASEPD
jgi:hypothetical protein